MIIPWFHLISPTNGWNIKLEPDGTSEEDPIQIRWTSHQITISVGYIYCIYIYTYTLCNPILNNSLCNPIQIPVSTTVKTTTKPSFSQVFLWVFPLFCWFFPHSKCHPRPAFIPRGAASLRPGTAVCGPRWGSGWVLDGSMGFHQQLNGDFLWNVSPETNGDLDGM